MSTTILTARHPWIANRHGLRAESGSHSSGSGSNWISNRPNRIASTEQPWLVSDGPSETL